MTHSDTKTRILDCAEQMFAREGFHNTSLRNLTTLAGVNLAAVNYHFGSKEELLQAVMERRMLPLNEIRQTKMREVTKQARELDALPAAAELLRAFVVPTLEFKNSSPGARDFITLIGRSLSDPDETVRHCFLTLALPTFKTLFTFLEEALPEIPSEILLVRMQFIMGTLSHVMCTSHQHFFHSSEFPQPLTPNALIEQLMIFIQAGLEAAR